jgi:hypothetical protein
LRAPRWQRSNSATACSTSATTTSDPTMAGPNASAPLSGRTDPCASEAPAVPFGRHALRPPPRTQRRRTRPCSPSRIDPHLVSSQQMRHHRSPWGQSRGSRPIQTAVLAQSLSADVLRRRPA